MTEEELLDAIVGEVLEEGVDVEEETIREVAAIAFRRVADSVEVGDEVEVPRLGTFRTSLRERRAGIHPDDEDQDIAIPPSAEVTFEPVDALLEKLRGEE